MTRTQTLRIADNLHLPADAQTSTLLVLGGKGMGKTNLGRVIVEELSRLGLRWAALDPLGVWWGLRYSKDGKGRGIECLILGGVHGDMPIEPTGGAVVADLVVDESISVIIDFSRKPSGEMWSIGERTRFITEYAKRLYQRQGGLVGGQRRSPIFQMLDEAARYVPQIIPHGNPELAKCLGAWEALVEEGRNIGVGIGLLTQRSARINKSVSELADALFAFRTVGPNSVEAVTDWLGEHVPKSDIKQHVETLRSLERGRCLVVSPGWLKFEGIANVRAGETFDSSATPKPGERQAKVTGAGAKPDLAKYQERMRETIERAKENDPSALKREVERLKKEVAAKPSAPAAVTVADRKIAAKAATASVSILNQQNAMIARMRAEVEQAMKVIARVTAFGFEATKVNPKEVERAVQVAVEQIGQKVAKAADVRRAEFEKLKGELEALLGRLGRLVDKKIDISVDVIRANPPFALNAVPVVARIPKSAVSVTYEGHGTLARVDADAVNKVLFAEGSPIGKTQSKILRAMAEFEAIGVANVTRAAVASWCGIKSTTGTFKNYLSELRVAGLIVTTAEKLQLTDAGRSLAGEVPAVANQAELLARAKQVIGSTQGRMLEVIHGNRDGISRAAVAEQLGISPTTGTYKNYISELRTAGMIVDIDRETVKCADWMYF